MALSRSASWWRPWAIRAIAAFLAVYMLGSFGIPTFIAYVTAVIFVVVDGVRQFSRRREYDPRDG